MKTNIFNGIRPSIGQQFTVGTTIYTVEAIGAGVVIGKLISVAIAASHKSLITITEQFK